MENDNHNATDTLYHVTPCRRFKEFWSEFSCQCMRQPKHGALLSKHCHSIQAKLLHGHAGLLLSYQFGMTEPHIMQVLYTGPHMHHAIQAYTLHLRLNFFIRIVLSSLVESITSCGKTSWEDDTITYSQQYYQDHNSHLQQQWKSIDPIYGIYVENILTIIQNTPCVLVKC